MSGCSPNVLMQDASLQASRSHCACTVRINSSILLTARRLSFFEESQPTVVNRCSRIPYSEATFLSESPNDFDTLIWPPTPIIKIGPLRIKPYSVDLVRGIRAGEETRLDRRAKVELFEQIRRENDHGGGPGKGGARE